MKNHSIRIKSIRVDRARGIDRDNGFELNGLSPGINLLHGPNGSGKSTSCAAAMELLWPGNLERPSVNGIISDTDDEWRIDIDAGHVQAYLNGQAGNSPDFGPSERSKRYYLGLHDLITENNEDFARKVADASRGGYDLDAAAQSIGARPRLKLPTRERKQILKARAQVDEARSKQQKIQEDAEQLDDFRRDRNLAEEAGTELSLLEKVKEYTALQDECGALQREFDAFPESIARLHGDEKVRLDELSAEHKRLFDRLRNAEQRIEAGSEKREKTSLDGEISHVLLADLRARRQELNRLETHIAEQERRRDEARAEVNAALEILGEGLSEQQLSKIAAVQNRDLSAFARRVHRIRGQASIIDERRAWLEKDPSDDVRDISREDIRRGIDALTAWLSADHEADQGEVRKPILLIIALAVALVAAVLTVLSANWIATILLIVAIALALIDILLSRNRKPADDPRPGYESSYRRLPLPDPSAWTREMVRVKLDQLLDLAGKRALEDERLSRRHRLDTEIAKLNDDENTIAAESRAIRETLGITIDIDDEWLPVLVGRIDDWQEATNQLIGAEAALEVLHGKARTLREQIDDALSGFGYEPVELSDEAEQHIADLAHRKEMYVNASTEISSARCEIEQDIEPAIASVADARKKLFDRIGISESEKYLIYQWLDDRPAFIDCERKLNNQKSILKHHLDSLGEIAKSMAHSVDELLAIDPIELDRRIADCRTKNNRRDELIDKIGRVEERIEAAKKGHELARALEAMDNAVNALDATREENSKAITANVLTQWVRNESVNRSRPAVFKRANELFVRFTRGTLRLELEDHANSPAFVGRRGNEPAQSLDQLSGGERIQLLIAVRLAFLEQDESKPLPLFVDEVLGTSDDERSDVMIDTMIEIARQGRQVIYSTAQHDEVNKWIARLDQSRMDYRRFDLAEIRSLHAARRNPLDNVSIERTAPLSPDGMSYDEYGRGLGVPGINPEAVSADDVHLWHLLDDTHVLHDLLCKGISSWNQLRTLLDYGTSNLLSGIDEAGVRARAKVIERACQCRRIGRPNPVDRRALDDSGAITDTFREPVADLCTRLNGDAAAIIDELERGEVPRFRQDNILKLRDYFEEHGYMPTTPMLSAEDIRLDLLSHLDSEIRMNHVTIDFIDRTIAAFRLEDDQVEEPLGQMGSGDGALPSV